MDNHNTGALLTMAAGATLAILGFTRPRPRQHRPGYARAVARLVWDLTFGLLQLIWFAVFALAPRTGKPHQPRTTRTKGRS